MLHSISGLEVDLGHKFQSGYGYYFFEILLLLLLLIILKVMCSY